jgi:hypothetical protein
MLCPSCHYDLASLPPGPCPECGRPGAIPTPEIQALILAASDVVRRMFSHELPGQPLPTPHTGLAIPATIDPAHLFLALLANPSPSIQACLAWCSTQAAIVTPLIIATLPRVDLVYHPEGSLFKLSSASHDLFAEAARTAERLGEPHATPEHLLFALLNTSPPTLATQLAELGLSPTNLQAHFRTRDLQPGSNQPPELQAKAKAFFSTRNRKTP